MIAIFEDKDKEIIRTDEDERELAEEWAKQQENKA